MQWRGFGPWRQEVRSFLELFALCGVAIAQPAFDLVTKNASLLVTLRTTRLEAIALAVALVVGPPLVLWVVEVVLGLVVPRARPVVHVVLAAAVVAVIAAEVLKHQSDLGGSAVVGAAVVIAIGAGLLIARFDVVRLWLRFLAIAPVLFAALFLLSPEVSASVFDGGADVADAPSARPNRVVMIVLDELPLDSLLDGSGRIDAALFPHLAALANESTWYRNTTTVAPDTEHAVPAITSGSYPTDPKALPISTEYPHNLFTLLGSDYEMNVHEPVTQLCPRDVCEAPASVDRRQGFDTLLHDTLVLWREFAEPGRDSEQVSFDASSVSGASLPTGTGFVRSLEPASKPRLDYLHILLPHQPWHLRPGPRDDDSIQRSRGMFVGDWGTYAAAQSGRQRHLLQLQLTDELVGDVVAKLRRIGAYRDSLVVVTADHGIAFTGGTSERGVTAANYPQILWTPMLVKAPGQDGGRVDDRPALSVDLLPTIADVLDIDLPWKVDGRSLLGPPRRDGERRIFEWKGNKLQPPPGEHYVTLDGPAGFAQVVRSQASAAPGDPTLRLYRLGPFGDLVGRRAAPLVDASAPAAVGLITDREHFEHVDRDATHIPWAFVEGTVRAPANQSLAIAVNGVVAGTASTVPRGAQGARTAFWATLAPRWFVDGHNDVRLYLVTGTPTAPALVPVQLRG